jgi:hypothetical protein
LLQAALDLLYQAPDLESPIVCPPIETRVLLVLCRDDIVHLEGMDGQSLQELFHRNGRPRHGAHGGGEGDPQRIDRVRAGIEADRNILPADQRGKVARLQQGRQHDFDVAFDESFAIDNGEDAYRSTCQLALPIIGSRTLNRGSPNRGRMLALFDLAWKVRVWSAY